MSGTQQPQKAAPVIGAATPITAPASSGGTVSIACKLPSGIILRVFQMESRTEPVMGGGVTTVKQAVQVGEPVVIKGAAYPTNTAPTQQIVGGYALTHGVSQDTWDAWLSQNRDSDIVKKNLIFASPTPDRSADQASEQREVRSGLEPIDPAKPMRGVSQAERKAA